MPLSNLPFPRLTTIASIIDSILETADSQEHASTIKVVVDYSKWLEDSENYTPNEVITSLQPVNEKLKKLSTHRVTLGAEGLYPSHRLYIDGYICTSQ